MKHTLTVLAAHLLAPLASLQAGEKAQFITAASACEGSAWRRIARDFVFQSRRSDLDPGTSRR
ncbi:MAG: hypothetical protein NTY19_24520 [Planctomycetota bacterium]|nr:hypothetical protein [Planctomycetota bacterium]